MIATANNRIVADTIRSIFPLLGLRYRNKRILDFADGKLQLTPNILSTCRWTFILFLLLRLLLPDHCWFIRMGDIDKH